MKPLSYTQHSVAFAILSPGERIIDSINVNGADSSIEFEWVSLGEQWPNGALKVNAFSDAFPILLDSRILDLLGELRRKRDRNRDVTPQVLIEMLEARGATPSTYHLRGLDDGNLSLAAKERLQKKMEKAIKREQG